MECTSGILQALNVNVYGNGTQTLVLSHGFGADQTIWHYVVPALVMYFKVLVYNLAFSPNVDSSFYDPTKYHNNFSAYAQDVTCILDQLHLKNIIFVGHSMSAMVGCIAAVNRPDLFQHLFLLNGSPRYINTKYYHGGFTRRKINAIIYNIKTNFSGWAHDLAPQAIGTNDTAAIAEFEFSLKRMDPKIALDVAKTIFLADNRPVLLGVRDNTTIIQTRNDLFVPPSVPYYMKRKMKRAHRQLIFVPGVGHFPQLTDYAILLHTIKLVLNLDPK